MEQDPGGVRECKAGALELSMLRTSFTRIRVARYPVRISEVLKEVRSRAKGRHVLRWGVVEASDTHVVCEVATVPISVVANSIASGVEVASVQGGAPVAVIVPTGIGASIGGFVGDAGPIVKAFESTCGHVVTHPNVVNGAGLLASDRSHYVDGLTLDRFLEGIVRLGPTTNNAIGLILDQISEVEKSTALNAVNALRAVNGLKIVGVAATTSRVGARVERTKYGHHVGRVENGEALLHAARRLIAAGAQSLAVVTAIDGVSPDDLQKHYAGQAPNPVGAVEALVSRFLTFATGKPCAHAPAYSGLIGETGGLVLDARAASEFITRSGLPSVLMGLARAPVPVTSSGIHVRDLAAIVIPSGCGGGVATLAAERYDIPLVEVLANRCCIRVSPGRFVVKRSYSARTYAEALGICVGIRAGIDPDRLLRDSVETVPIL